MDGWMEMSERGRVPPNGVYFSCACCLLVVVVGRGGCWLTVVVVGGVTSFRAYLGVLQMPVAAVW